MATKPVCRTTAAILGTVAALAASVPASAQSGAASWYGSGHRTANGERFNPNGMTAAHRSLPFGTRVRVADKRTGRSVVVRINDRGPFVKGRMIDLSKGAAGKLGFVGAGHARVQIEPADGSGTGDCA